MRERQQRRHPRAQRIAHDVGARDVEMIHQRAHIAGHGGDVIGGRVVEFAGIAMAAIVERDDAAAAPFSSDTQVGYTQFTFLFDAKPCTSTIGSPSPSSR